MTSPIQLDDLLAEHLPPHIIEDIGNITITINDMIEWDAKKPKIRIRLTEETVHLEVNIRIPFPKFVALVIVLSFLTGIGQFISTHHLSNFLSLLH